MKILAEYYFGVPAESCKIIFYPEIKVLSVPDTLIYHDESLYMTRKLENMTQKLENMTVDFQQ